LAALAKDLIDQVKSGSLRDIQDLMETSVYLVDAVTAALVYNRKEWIRAGIDEDRKARALYDKIVDRLKLQLTADKNSSAGTNSLLGFAAKTKTIIDQTRETAGSLSSLWESPVVRVNSQ
jgi:hypothetical protein